MDGGSDAVTEEAERAVFVEAIARAWDDPAPLLVYSDWLEERDEDGVALLRWYANEVLPAVAAASEPVDDDYVYLRPVYEWRKVQRRLRRQIADHSNATSLFRFGAVAICGLERVRNALPLSCQELVSEFRLFALGLATGERMSDLRVLERETVHRICFGRYSPKAVASEFEPQRPDDAEVRLFALDAANPRANPTSIPKPYPADDARSPRSAPDLDPMLFWGALHRTLANVPAGPVRDPWT